MAASSADVPCPSIVTLFLFQMYEGDMFTAGKPGKSRYAEACGARGEFAGVRAHMHGGAVCVCVRAHARGALY